MNYGQCCDRLGAISDLSSGDQEMERLLEGKVAIITGAGRGIGRVTARLEKAAHGEAHPRKIVNISSTSGMRGNAGQSNYSSGKAGVIGLTKTLAKEWGQFNIQVNAVAFGRIDTRLTQAKEKGESIKRGDAEIAIGIPGERLERTTPMIPMGRAGSPQEGT